MGRIYGYLGNKPVLDENMYKAAILPINNGLNNKYIKKVNDWALGINQLVIQGINNNIQPFYLNKINAVYDGEIYNYKELKTFLITRNYSFHDNCDGSVIIPLYELYGEDFVKYLDGIFAVAIIDERTVTKLTMASDLSAVKSLYYYWDKVSDTFYFSSELMSLFAFHIPKKLRLEAVDEYLIGGTIWHNRTFFDDIYSLGPAALLIKTSGEKPELSQYISNISNNWDASLGFEKTSYYLNYLFEREIKQVVQSSVPICVVTNGSLDSSYIAALACKYVSDLHCFNVAYENDLDQEYFAKEISDYYGTKYHQVLIRESDIPNILEKTIYHLGQPNSAPHSLSTYALFKAISSAGFKVAIASEGVDEYFAGYEYFKKAVFNQESTWINQYFDVMCTTTQEIRNTVYSEAYKDFLNKKNIIC